MGDGRAENQRITEARSEINGAIIVVDEASLASTMQMRDLMKISEALTNEKTFYVEISRARDRAIIVTYDRMQLAETLAANSGEAVSALQGIGAEPMTTRGMATEAQMAEAIQSARDDSSMSLEEREAEWAEMPPIEADREYGVEGDMAADLAADRADTGPHHEREKTRDAGMAM